MIPFNKPFLTGNELKYISQAHLRGQLAGDGYFTKVCSEWLEQTTGCKKVLLTHSCTAALEMAAILTNIQQGDEVIMPSYTFVSTANAFVLRGAVPIFVDIDPNTCNLDASLIEEAITSKTKIIVVVHYAGVACDMDRIMTIANNKGILVVEDAAQAIMGQFSGRALGTIGHLGCYSFHETKNVISGEGGALLINDSKFFDRAEVIREKGTNRTKYFQGQVDKYTWIDIGSSYLPGEIVAAFLWAQLQEASNITNRRLKLYNEYHHALLYYESIGRIRLPRQTNNAKHNGHMYYILCKDLDQRQWFIKEMAKRGIQCVFHYSPLHNSPNGINKTSRMFNLNITCDIANRIVRLPLWLGMESSQPYIIKSIKEILELDG